MLLGCTLLFSSAKLFRNSHGKNAGTNSAPGRSGRIRKTEQKYQTNFTISFFRTTLSLPDQGKVNFLFLVRPVD